MGWGGWRTTGEEPRAGGSWRSLSPPGEEGEAVERVWGAPEVGSFVKDWPCQTREPRHRSLPEHPCQTREMGYWRLLWCARQAPWAGLQDGPLDTSWLPDSHLGPGSPGVTGTFWCVSVWSPIRTAHLRKRSLCRFVLGRMPCFPCLRTWPARHGQLWPPTHHTDQTFPLPRSQNTSRVNTV